jgi:hypothetical protein
MNTTSNRRSFLTTLSVIAASVVCGVNRFTAAWAEDLKPGSLPALDESNPVATALGYRHDEQGTTKIINVCVGTRRFSGSFCC